MTVRGQAILELLAHDQGEERAEDMAADGTRRRSANARAMPSNTLI